MKASDSDIDAVVEAKVQERLKTAQVDTREPVGGGPKRLTWGDAEKGMELPIKGSKSAKELKKTADGILDQFYSKKR